MSLKRSVLAVIVGLTIALSGQPVSAQKGPAAVGQLRIGGNATPIYGFDFSAAGVADYGGGTSGGRTTFNAIGITRLFDAVSVELFQAIATGVHFKRIEIVVYRPGTTTVESTYGLNDVVVTSLKSGPGTESVGFTYAQIDVTGGGSSFCFNILTNSGC